jgi:uncharacterized phage protein gp47/JayE
MFEAFTFEVILEDMLSRVTNDVDKREGSMIYDALAPAAYHLAEMYFYLDTFFDLVSIDTAVGIYLDRKAAEYGIIRKAATFSMRKMEASGAVNIGTRWGLNDTTYVVKELILENKYKVQCEQSGIIGNAYTGNLENIDNVSGVTARLTEILIKGANEEDDESLRKRIQEYLVAPSQDGNAAQYKKWATEYSGIGAAKVFPLWNGGNTVKIAITDSSCLPAGSELIAKFQGYIDPGAEGLGNGVAPIGSKVTVTGGTKKNISIAAKVVLAEGFAGAEGAASAITAYLASIAYVKSSVSYMRIGSALLDCVSIADISGLTINDGITDIALVGDEIPVLTDLSLTVVIG